MAKQGNSLLPAIFIVPFLVYGATTLFPSPPAEETSPYYLDIPSISLSLPLSQTHQEDRTIPVPDSGVAYLQTGSNILLLGHTPGAFSRLSEIPQSLTLTLDSIPTSYSLLYYEDISKDEVDMGKVMDYNGLVLMTCSGDPVGENRLTLYYTENTQ